MRSRRSSSGWLLGDTKAYTADESLRRHLFLRAHVEGGSGRCEASPTAILQDTHSVEEEFAEVRKAPVKYEGVPGLPDRSYTAIHSTS